MTDSSTSTPRKFNLRIWVSVLIGIYFAYNLVFGLWTALAPESYFEFAGTQDVESVIGWRLFGAVCILWAGLGVLLIANPVKFRWVSWAAILSSVIAVPALFISLRNNDLSGAGFLFSFPFDLLGLIIMPAVAYRIYKFREKERVSSRVFEDPMHLPEMAEYETNKGVNLADLSKEKPVLLVFLRHFGCTFCREAMDEVSRNRDDIEAKGAEIVLVHMVEHGIGDDHLFEYGLLDTHQISDPTKKLYNAFELKRGKFSQLFGLRSWVEGFRAGAIKGYGIGKEAGDNLQMPGLFVISDGKVVQGFRHQYASDRPDYVDMASCVIGC